MKKTVRALASTAALVLWSKAVWAQWGVLPDPMQTDWTGTCRNARFLDGQNGYLVSDGQRPTFLKTTNGGTSWTTSKPMLATAASGSQGISFILDASTAFATSDALVLSNTAANRVARTINGVEDGRWRRDLDQPWQRRLQGDCARRHHPDQLRLLRRDERHRWL